MLINMNNNHNIVVEPQITQQFDSLRLVLNQDNEELNDNNISISVTESSINCSANCVANEELPNQISSAFLCEDSYDSNRSTLNYTELTSSFDTNSVNSSISIDVWKMNYNESAIYLEEGFNNDKFDFHPRTRSTLPIYLIVHNHYFYSLDLFASLLLLSLALIEKPAITGFQVNEGIHASLELLALSIVGIELFMKYRWMKIEHFIRHTRTTIKSIVLLIMIIEALVVLIRRDSHFRVTRALRPVFLIDNHYCGGIRRVVRQILQSLPPFVDMLVLLFFFMFVFAIFGFYLFSPNSSDQYFSSIGKSFVSLFVLLTTANFPDVMMPSYKQNRISCLFFIAFLVIHLYFLMNIMLAVVYEAFTRIEKDKFRKLLLHRRKACRHAFALLVTRMSPKKISFKHFEGLMLFYKPNASKLDTYLMFKALDANKSGFITLNEFYNVYEVSDLKWQPNNPQIEWFSDFRFQWIKKICQTINKLVNHKWFQISIYIMISTSAVYQITEAILRSSSSYKKEIELIQSSPISLIFVSLYGIEASLKLIGFGLYRYFDCGWNRFDFCITVFAIIGLIFEGFYLPFSFVFVLRSLRLLKLLKYKARYRDIMGAFIFIIVKRFGSVSIVVLVVYYNFAILGMELFSSYDLMNCCKNTNFGQYFAYSPNSTLNGYYYLNNFTNIISSYVTLFELMVVNNWYIIMDGYAFVSSEWSRIYFMTFYIVTLVVITIVVAFVLETFLFRIQYRHKMGDIDKDTMIAIDVTLSQEELNFCYDHSSRVRSISQLLRFSDDLFHSQSNRFNTIIYRGSRARTKFSFSLNIYSDEIIEWTQKADEEEREKCTQSRTSDNSRQYSRITRRTHSCSS